MGQNKLLVTRWRRHMYPKLALRKDTGHLCPAHGKASQHLPILLRQDNCDHTDQTVQLFKTKNKIPITT